MVENEVDKNLINLKSLTEELATEIYNRDEGNAFNFCKLIFDNLRTYVAIINLDNTVQYINPSLHFLLSSLKMDVKVGDEWFSKAWNLKTPPKNHPAKEAFETRKVVSDVIVSPISNTKYEVIAIPLIFNGISGSICLFNAVK